MVSVLSVGEVGERLVLQHVFSVLFGGFFRGFEPVYHGFAAVSWDGDDAVFSLADDDKVVGLERVVVFGCCPASLFAAASSFPARFVVSVAHYQLQFQGKGDGP
jgi:hypothetical protein